MSITSCIIDFEKVLGTYYNAYPEEACNALPFSKDDIFSAIGDKPWILVYGEDKEK